MQSLLQNLDELHLHEDKNITKALETDENILLSTNVFKFNRKNKRQERRLMITTKAMYNLSKSGIKRKILLNKVRGITVSVLGAEFVIHVPEEYDYRYSSSDKREAILEKIICGFQRQTLGQQIPFYYIDEISTEKYTTTKADKKKNLNRMPSFPPVCLNLDAFLKKIEGHKEEEKETRKKTGTLYSKKKGEDISLSDFTLLKVLGRGAFGKVMLVEKKDSKEIYALKSLRKEEIIEKDQLEHTKTEKMILEHINHPFLVSLVYSFQTPEKLFFVMQFMKGGELFQHLRNSKRFDENRAKFYAAQILLALGHLHAKEIVYRDLKPENILMDENGNVCLTDFGMAKILRKNDVSMSFCGTPEYLAPEIITGEGHAKPADWWSFGIFIYEMLFGLPPFYSQNQNMMFQLIRDADVKFPVKPEISDDAKDIILKLLIKDQKKRFGSVHDATDIMSHSWFKEIKWSLLEKKEIPSPFKPKINGDLWVSNFDEEFTREEAINSYVVPNSELLENYESEFKEFDSNSKK